MKRGHTEVTTRKPDNYYQGKALILANEGKGGTGGLSMELYKQIWGQIITGDSELNAKALDDIEFMQNIDLTRQYTNRSFEIMGQAQTALMHNESNNFLIARCAPVLITDELNFHSNRKEWNQIEYTRLSETGIAEETSFSEWQWTDKLERRKLEAKVTMELALDNNYGATIWQENLAVLASTGLLTLMKEAAYGLITLGYTNLVESRVRKNEINLSELFRYETRALMSCCMSMELFLQHIRNAQDKIPGYNAVIMPYKTSQRLRDMVGESRPLDAISYTLNPQTQDFERRLMTGAVQSVKTIRVGDRDVNFYEMTGFKASERLELVEDPLVARVVLCQSIPCNHNVRAGDDVLSECATADSLDWFFFYQTKEVGEDRRVAFKEALRHCFAYNAKTGEVSQHMRNLCAKKNAVTDPRRRAPYAFNSVLNRGYVADDINDEDQNYDYETPDGQALQGHNDLREMLAWRQHCCLLTYDPAQGEWRVPRLVGDLSLSALPHAWALRVAKILERCFPHFSPGHSLRQLIDDTNALLDRIEQTELTEDYVKALIDAQMPYILKADGTVEAKDVDGIQSFRANDLGSAYLPTNETGALDGMAYPPLFTSAANLETLAREANKPGSSWQRSGQEVQALLPRLRALQAYLREAMGDTDVINAAYGVSSLDTLIAAIRGRSEAVYAGVPTEAAHGELPGVVIPTVRGLDLLVDYLRGTTAANVNIVGYNVLSSTALIALFSLNALTFDDFKGDLLDYFDTEKPEELRALLERLYEAILGMTPFNSARDANAVKTASVITSMVVAEIRKGNLKTAGDIITKSHGKQWLKARTTEWETEKNKYWSAESESDALRDNLRRAIERTNQLPGRTYPAPVGGIPDVAARRQTVATNLGARRARFFQGTYTDEPANYLRLAVNATPALDDFIAKTGFRWVVPASPTRPEKPADEQEMVQNRAKAIAEAREKLYKGLHALSAAQSTFKALGGRAGSDDDEVEEMDVDYRAGRQGFGMPLGARAVGRGNLMRPRYVDTGTPDITNEFFGPWRERLRFANTLENDAQRFLFLALIQTKNTLDVHLRLADRGAQLINVILFRPFIELTAKSAIVLEEGALLTGMSRPRVVVSKEDRGVFHVGSSFYTGTVRTNPAGVELIPLCDADRFIGGKNHGFVQSAEDWELENPLKPSIIALPTAVGERTYGSPIDMLNAPTYLRPGIDLENHFRKYSSADLYEQVFSSHVVQSVETAHVDRTTYWKYCIVSHVGHLAPRRFVDARTGLPVQYNGIGPGNDIRMNMPEAEKTWDGQASEFPKAVPAQIMRSYGA